MGLFDRLFGKKKPAVQEEQVVEDQLLDQLEELAETSQNQVLNDPLLAAEVGEPVQPAELVDNQEPVGFEEPAAPIDGEHRDQSADGVDLGQEGVAETEESFEHQVVLEESQAVDPVAGVEEEIATAVESEFSEPALEEAVSEPAANQDLEPVAVTSLESVAETGADASEEPADQLAEETLALGEVAGQSSQELAAEEEEALESIKSEQVEPTFESVKSEEVGSTLQEAADELDNSDQTVSVESDQSASSQHFSDLMADYYAKKAAVQAAVERGEELVLEAKETRVVEQLVSDETSSEAPAQPDQTHESTDDKYHRTLKKTRTGFGARLNAFLANFRRVDEEFFEELEELLILSDVGVTVATKLTEELRYEAKLEKAKRPEDLRRVIIAKLVEIYEKDGFDSERVNFQEGLTVMLFVGVNGVGKTTSIGKLAYQYKQAGKRVMLVAADTFRAGAVVQLVEWGRRVDVPVVTGPEKADPASVVFDGMEKAVAEGVDILLIDTAGRLQNKDHLMAELEKIGRIIKRVLPAAPHETLLALDASTGQNALSQAKEFSKITPLTGLVLTKLDGTAKGGVVLAIREELDIPVKFIGFGEKIDDIGAFRSEDFMKGLLDGLV